MQVYELCHGCHAAWRVKTLASPSWCIAHRWPCLQIVCPTPLPLSLTPTRSRHRKAYISSCRASQIYSPLNFNFSHILPLASTWLSLLPKQQGIKQVYSHKARYTALLVSFIVCCSANHMDRQYLQLIWVQFMWLAMSELYSTDQDMCAGMILVPPFNFVGFWSHHHLKEDHETELRWR